MRKRRIWPNDGCLSFLLKMANGGRTIGDHLETIAYMSID